MNMNDPAAGVLAAGGGSVGLFVQAMTSYTNLGVTILNLALAILGLYLIWPKVIKRWRGP